MSDDTISTAEAAVILGVSQITVGRYVRDGRLAAERLPYGRGVYRLRLDEVKALADRDPRRVAARTLREAADAFQATAWESDDDELVALGGEATYSIAKWMRIRADEIEGRAPDPARGTAGAG